MFIVYVYHNGWLAVDKFDDIAAANAFADRIGGRVFDYHEESRGLRQQWRGLIRNVSTEETEP